MNRLVLNRQLVSAKGGISGVNGAAGARRRHLEAEDRLSDRVDRISAAWMWRAALAVSMLVWGAVIWALVAHVFHF